MFRFLILLTVFLTHNSYAEITELGKQSVNTEANYFNPNATCSYFLREFDPDAPDYFKYESCDTNNDEQAKPIEVIYTIDGQFAKQAEHYLIENMGIDPLQFLCCYWTSGGWPAGSFVNPKDNTTYTIAFSSEETLSWDWSEITFFLTIKVCTEDF